MIKLRHSTIVTSLKHLPLSLRINSVTAMARKIQYGDKRGEIAWLSRYFIDSLPRGTAVESTKELAAHYDKANALAWIAYSLLDSMIDRDNSATMYSQTTLSASLFIKSTALSLYGAHSQDHILLTSLFESTDESIFKETHMCRATVTTTSITIPHLPTRSELQSISTHKSLVHIAGPALLVKRLYPDKFNELLGILKIYCGVRQQLDDLHDWEGDIREGHMTPVVATLLLRYDAVEESVHPFESIIPDLRRIFWETVAEELCIETQRKTQKAINSLQSLLDMAPDAVFIVATLQPILQSTTLTIETIRRQKKLLKSLRSKQA